MVEYAYRILGATIVLAGSGVSIDFHRRADRASAGERISLNAVNPILLVSLRLVGMTLWLSMLAGLFNPAWMAWSQVELPPLGRLSGAVLGASAAVLAYWIFSSLGDNVAPTVVTRTPNELVRHGACRWVRQPLYTVGLHSYLAFSLLAANWIVAGLAVLAFCIIALRVPHEERQRIERNGAPYRKHARGIGKYLPGLR